MRVKQTQPAATRNTGLAGTMKLVIAVVFTLTVALLNATQRPALQPAEIHVNETAAALAPVKSDPKPAAAAQETPVDATPQPKPFDANDPTTWPKCAADEIVRADNGQCSKAVTPAPATTTTRAAAPAAPISNNDAKAFIYQKESGNRTDAINPSSGACGLGQALPCSKLPCSLSDYACQDAWFTNYAMQRYGSWENAAAFWRANHWW